MCWHNAGNAHKPKSLDDYIKRHMHLHKGVHAHTQRNTWTHTKKYMHIYKGVHTLIRKEHMRLYKEAHALGQEVVMLALRNTRTRQGNRRPCIRKYMHIRQGAHVLLQDCENGFPRHSMPCALRFRCGMMRKQRGATPPRVFERYLFWWLWTTEVTPKEKPPTRKTNEGMLTS